MGRMSVCDYACVWLCCLLFFFFVTSLPKFSLVLSVFAIANLALLVLLFSCSEPDGAQVNAFFDSLKIVAHRGLTDDAPENTLAAIRTAKELGADGVEFDVELSKDGVPVLMHDATVDRTTDGRGDLSSLTWSQISKLNAAANFADKDRFPFAAVPSVEQAVQLCLELGLKIIIDVKVGDPRILSTLLKLFRSHKELYSTAIVCSFYPRLLYELKRSDPSILIGHTWRPWFYTCFDVDSEDNRFKGQLWMHLLAILGDKINVWWLHSWLWKFSGASFVLTEHQSISKEYIKIWKRRGMHVGAWTVNDRHEKIYCLNTLQLTMLTDRLSDIQEFEEDTKL